MSEEEESFPFWSDDEEGPKLLKRYNKDRHELEKREKGKWVIVIGNEPYEFRNTMEEALKRAEEKTQEIGTRALINLVGKKKNIYEKK
jgi:hypothetical protein